MISNPYFKKLLPLLLALPVMALLVSLVPSGSGGGDSHQKINLALRRTAHGLLRESGDSTSRIPAVEQASAGVWRIRLEGPFLYELLPAMLQASLDRYGVGQPYEVAVRRCGDGIIDLGYHWQDLLEGGEAPCVGREMPPGCHFIEVTFLEKGGSTSKFPWLLLIPAALAGLWFYLRLRPAPASPGAEREGEWLAFGNSRLDAPGQTLVCGDVRQTLTFREAKLLRLFAESPGRLLEREHILSQVWADEGVLVGRSVDVFVSRLRKKLAPDPSVSIVAVHGVGYRLETKEHRQEAST